MTAILTSSDKWWFSVMVGVVAFVIYSSFVYNIINSGFKAFKCAPLSGSGVSFLGVLLQSAILIIVIRLILW
jgi:hypothetical protein